MMGHRVKASHRPCGQRIDQLGTTQLPAGYPLSGLFGSVGDIDQAGDNRKTPRPASRPAGDVRLEQGGVQQVWPAGGGQTTRSPQPASTATCAGKAEQLHTSRLKLLLQPGSPMEVGNIQHDAPRYQVGRQSDQRALGAARDQAVDDVEDVHGANDARSPSVEM